MWCRLKGYYCAGDAAVAQLVFYRDERARLAGRYRCETVRLLNGGAAADKDDDIPSGERLEYGECGDGPERGGDVVYSLWAGPLGGLPGKYIALLGEDRVIAILFNRFEWDEDRLATVAYVDIFVSDD